MIYRTFNSLNNKTLKSNDTVVLSGMRHKVSYNYLVNCSGESNEAIFDKISIEDSAESLASKAYGYRATGGCWPECNNGDYEALTRLVLVLLAFIEGNKSVSVKIDKEWIEIGVNIKQPITMVKLTSEYDAKLHRDYVELGCQDIPYSAVQEILKRAKKLKYTK
jgi:hypothetical protein